MYIQIYNISIKTKYFTCLGIHKKIQKHLIKTHWINLRC